MFGTVLEDNAFIMENADSLKRMGKFQFFLAFLSLIRLPLCHHARNRGCYYCSFPLQVRSALYCARCLNRLCGTKRK